MTEFQTLKNYARSELIIEKSKFIGTAFPCGSEEEAKDWVTKIKKEFSDATHNCHGYICDRTGSLMRFSDDGEPQGTAGMPILEVIRQKKLVETGVVVTRYFGGIKLGAGGLVRAYTKGATAAIDKGGIACYKTGFEVKITVTYSSFQFVERFLKEQNFTVLLSEFLEDVKLKVLTSEEKLNFLQSEVSSLTLGQGKLEILKKDYFAF